MNFDSQSRVTSGEPPLKAESEVWVMFVREGVGKGRERRVGGGRRQGCSYCEDCCSRQRRRMTNQLSLCLCLRLFLATSFIFEIIFKCTELDAFDYGLVWFA
jgi:hypothetical protein